MSESKIYLGDGAYAEVIVDCISVAVPFRDQTIHFVMDGEALKQLIEFAKANGLLDSKQAT